MAATLAQIEKLNKKFKNLEIEVIEKTEDGLKADVFAIKYQRNGATPNKIGEGLIEVNAIWDERKSRPKGYYVAAAIDKGNGHCISVMITEEWLANNNTAEYKRKWEVEL